jgi:hypothetical protein
VVAVLRGFLHLQALCVARAAERDRYVLGCVVVQDQAAQSYRRLQEVPLPLIVG